MGRNGNVFFSSGHGWGFYIVVTYLHAGTTEFNVSCIVGIVGSFLWFVALLRSRELISLWNRKLADMEAVREGFPVFSSFEFKKIEQVRMSHSWIFKALILIIGACWLALSVYAMHHVLWIRQQ
jgi:hypothetical protein